MIGFFEPFDAATHGIRYGSANRFGTFFYVDRRINWPAFVALPKIQGRVGFWALQNKPRPLGGGFGVGAHWLLINCLGWGSDPI